MIDPTKFTNYNRTDAELEEALLFCVAAANNNANVAAKSVDKTLSYLRYVNRQENDLPFATIRRYSRFASSFLGIREVVKTFGLGKYTVKGRAFCELAYSGLDLRQCTVDDLERIHGIGPKTSRFFIVHTRPNARYAILDTHILRYMREKGYDVPKSTPNKKQYKIIESKFLEIVDNSNRTVAQFDLDLWNEYSGRLKVLDI